MLRFLSRRRVRGVNGQTASPQIKNQRLLSNKNIIQCQVILLDGTDLPIELSVSNSIKLPIIIFLSIIYCIFIFITEKSFG